MTIWFLTRIYLIDMIIDTAAKSDVCDKLAVMD